MIQTILITALSSQLTYLNPSITPTSTAPQVVFTRVLPEENYVTPVVEKPVVKPKNTELPELQKTIVYNAQLLEPIAGASASPTIIDSSLNAIAPQPKMTPTPQPTAIPAVMTAPPTQAPIAVAPSNTSSSLSDEA